MKFYKITFVFNGHGIYTWEVFPTTLDIFFHNFLFHNPNFFIFVVCEITTRVSWITLEFAFYVVTMIVFFRWPQHQYERSVSNLDLFFFHPSSHFSYEVGTFIQGICEMFARVFIDVWFHFLLLRKLHLY